jgi:hypothetical protein
MTQQATTTKQHPLQAQWRLPVCSVPELPSELPWLPGQHQPVRA